MFNSIESSKTSHNMTVDVTDLSLLHFQEHSKLHV